MTRTPLTKPKLTPAAAEFPAEFLRREPKTGDVLIDLHVMPNAPQTRLDGLHCEPGQRVLKVRLKAAPVDGQANEALIKWLAKQLGLAQRDLTLVRGSTARHKQIRVSAASAAQADWATLLAQP